MITGMHAIVLSPEGLRSGWGPPRGHPPALRAIEDHVGGILADQPELDATVTRLVADTWLRWAAAGDAYAMTGLGTLLKWQDDLDGARVCFERAVDAGYDRALLDLAVLRDGFIGETDAAIASLRRAARSRDPDVAAEGAGQLAQTLCQHGDLPGARAAFQAATGGEDRYLGYLVRPGAGGSGRTAQVGKHLAGLDGQVTGTGEVAVLVFRFLAGDENQPASGRNDNLGVCQGSGQVLWVDAFECHRGGLR